MYKNIKMYIFLSFFLSIFLANCDNTITVKDNHSFEKKLNHKNDEITNNKYVKDSVLDCNDPKKKNIKVSNSKILFTPFNNEISTKSSFYNINNNIINVINGTKGTLICIPKNCFVLLNGKMYFGEVKIELKEINKKSDFVLSDLQTVSDGKLLESGGMIFLEAYTKSGEKLKLKRNESIYIESFPSNEIKPFMKIFNGKYNNNKINWEYCDEVEKELISVPLKYLDFTYAYAAQWYYNSDSIWRKLREDIRNDKFRSISLSNTFIATREFNERFRYITSLTSSFYMKSKNKKYNPANAYDTILNIYLNNLDKDLWFVDSLVVIKTMSDIKMDNITKSDHNSFRFEIEHFKKFAREKRTKVMTINDYGINLSLSNALELLVSKGVKYEEAKEIVKKYNMQQAVINKMKEKYNKEYLTYTFESKQLGWINIDRYINIPIEKQKELIVKVNHEMNKIDMKCFVVFDKINSVISEKFSKNYDCKINGLPLNEKVKIFVYGYKNGKVYFGYRNLRVGDSNIEIIRTEIITIEELKKKVQDLI